MASEKKPIAANPGRRHFLAVASGTFGAAILASMLPRLALADDLPHLTTADDPTAKMLNYTEDASNAVAPHQAGQTCANCNFFQGGGGYGPCRLYAGKAVNAKGWCAGYAIKKT
jgi:High potential iron-sulfur protein